MTISPRTRVIALVSLSVLMALVSIQTAFAKVVINTIDPNAVVGDNGRHLVVTGPSPATAASAWRYASR